MVSEDAWRLIVNGLRDEILSLPIIARGAESELRLGVFSGIKAVFKIRRRKIYMDPSLDEDLRRARTLKEAKIIGAARESGARVPLLLAVFPSLFTIVMEYIEGPKLRDVVSTLDSGECRLLEEAGRILGILHEAGIVHGDPTTSNYIVSGRGVYMIDFGLSEFSTDIEDQAVDLHLFRRAVTSTHAPIADRAFECFVAGYRSVRGGRAERVLERADEIRLRGRYVEERRTVWGQS